MSRQLQRILILAMTAAPLLLTAGCATHNSVSRTVVIQPLPDVDPPRPLHLRVEWVELNHHEVVSRVDGYRHVLSDKPAAMATAAPKPKDLTAPVPASSPSKQNNKNTEPGAATHNASPTDPAVNSEMPRRKATTDAELAAWRKFCTGDALGKHEQVLLSATLMPSARKDHCKAGWHGEK